VKPWLDGDARYEVLDNFGYAAAEYFEDMGLFKSYATLFERYIASGLTTRERQFKNRDTFLQKVAENLRGSDHTSIEFSLYRNLASFLGNVPNNQKESVWRLAHACSSGMDWDAMLQSPRFKGVAQTFGFDQLPLLAFPKDEPEFVKKVGKDLQGAYIEAFERSPIELLNACVENRLQTHVHDVWIETKENDIHRGTLQVLEMVDARNKIFPPRRTELLG
jgi:hypothetical protein